MLHHFLGCILHFVWRISSISILRYNLQPTSSGLLEKETIEIHQISTSKAEQIRDSDVHSSPWFPPQRSCRYLSVQGNDHWSLKSKWQGSPQEISQAGLFHPKHGGLNWPWLSIRQSQKVVNRKSGFSLFWIPFSWRKSQIKLHTKMQQFMMLIFSKWFLHQSTYFPTRCYQMLSWTLNLDLYCKENKVLITTSMGLEANQPHTTSPSLPWNPLLLHCKKSDKNLGLKIVILPHLLEGSHTFTSLASIFQGPNALRSKNWGHGATL